MRPPVPETLLEKTLISGPETGARQARSGTGQFGGTVFIKHDWSVSEHPKNA